MKHLVATLMVHAHTQFVLLLYAKPGWARVEVHDCSSDPPQRRRPTARSEQGRGLLLLDRLADRWGWHEEQDGPTCKAVWFEVSAGTGGIIRTEVVPPGDR